MSGIFISYRREDSAASAGRLFDHLSARLGREEVFMDVDGIELGVDFYQVISEKVAACDALLAVIGKDWLSERLTDESDFVRIEIAAALERNVRVIPVLLDGATMPSSDQLPDALKLLARRNATHLTHMRFVEDAGRLADALQRILTVQSEQQHPSPRVDPGPAPLESSPIALSSLDASFKRFECDDQLHVGDIPAQKLSNAKFKCGVPVEETVLAMIDFTVMKNGNDALVITTAGIRVHHSSGDFDQPQFISHQELKAHPVEKHGWWQIRLGGTRITVSGGPDREIIVDFLGAIKADLV
ncbi:MAG: toll/interleukin-1 receptor domain-containing protein [Pseudomonadota bacterium]